MLERLRWGNFALSIHRITPRLSCYRSQNLGGDYESGGRQGMSSGGALGSSTMGTGVGSAGVGLGSGTTSQGLASGIQPRPRMADKNASTISIKSGVMGHDDTETLHEPSTSHPAYNANAMKPFPGMPSAGYSGASSGLTGNSLPDRSVGSSGRLVLLLYCYHHWIN